VLKKLNNVYILLFILIFSQYIIGQSKQTLAVLDLAGHGISQGEAVTLSERLITELLKTNKMALIERNQISEILSEQGLQQTGCTTVECAVEVGNLLGANYMISGTIGLIGKSYTLDLKMFSVETGRLEKAVSDTYKGEIDGLISMVELAAWEIMGIEQNYTAIYNSPSPVSSPISTQTPTKRSISASTGVTKVTGEGMALNRDAAIEQA